MFIVDIEGDFVNLVDKSIEILLTNSEGDYAEFDYMVVARSSIEFVYGYDGTILHVGSNVECEQFRDKLRNILHVIQVKGVTSTKRIGYE